MPGRFFVKGASTSCCNDINEHSQVSHSSTFYSKSSATIAHIVTCPIVYESRGFGLVSF